MDKWQSKSVKIKEKSQILQIVKMAKNGKARDPEEPPPYQAIPGEEKPTREELRRLPCCGCGTGWCLFIIGFFVVGVPWYIGAFILMCGKVNRREKAGYIACTFAAVAATAAVIYALIRILPHLIPYILSLL